MRRKGLSAKNSTKGSSMPRPGFSLSAMVASGQPLFCFGFWSRACAARRRAGPRAAAQRGGAAAGGSRGGALPRALVLRGVCSFLAPICVTSELREWSRCGGMDSLGPARAETRGRGHPRDACRPRDSRGPRARGRAAYPRRRDEQAGAGLSGRRSFRCPAGAGQTSAPRAGPARRLAGWRRNRSSGRPSEEHAPPRRTRNGAVAQQRSGSSQLRAAPETDQARPEMQNIDLKAVIGFTGDVPGGLVVHPSNKYVDRDPLEADRDCIRTTCRPSWQPPLPASCECRTCGPSSSHP